MNHSFDYISFRKKILPDLIFSHFLWPRYLKFGEMFTYVCMYVCMYVCIYMYVCMYVCMYVYMCVCVSKYVSVLCKL